MSTAKATLSAFKSLLRARQRAFAGDSVALKAARDKIRAEFVKNKDETNPQRIQELLEHAKAVETVLVENVLQARHTSGNTFRLRIRKDNALLENATTKFGKDGVVI